MFSCRIDDDLELRLLEPRHAEELFQVVDENRGDLRQWLPWVDSTRTPEATRGFIQQSLMRFAEEETIVIGVWWNAKLSGVVEGKRDNLNHAMDVGYWLAGRARGRGVMTRSCQELIRHAFDGLGLQRVQIRCAEENRSSCRIAERLGFAHEGTLRGALRLNGSRYADMRVYGITSAAWLKKNPGATKACEENTGSAD